MKGEQLSLTTGVVDGPGHALPVELKSGSLPRKGQHLQIERNNCISHEGGVSEFRGLPTESFYSLRVFATIGAILTHGTCALLVCAITD